MWFSDAVVVAWWWCRVCTVWCHGCDMCGVVMAVAWLFSGTVWRCDVVQMLWWCGVVWCHDGDLYGVLMAVAWLFSGTVWRL
jgi:hypothetical protein